MQSRFAFNPVIIETFWGSGGLVAGSGVDSTSALPKRHSFRYMIQYGCFLWAESQITPLMKMRSRTKSGSLEFLGVPLTRCIGILIAYHRALVIFIQNEWKLPNFLHGEYFRIISFFSSKDWWLMSRITLPGGCYLPPTNRGTVTWTECANCETEVFVLAIFDRNRIGYGQRSRPI